MDIMTTTQQKQTAAVGKQRSYKWRMDRDYIDKRAMQSQQHMLVPPGESARDACGEGTETYAFHKPRVRWAKLPIRWAYDKPFLFASGIRDEAAKAIADTFDELNNSLDRSLFVHDLDNPQIKIFNRPIDGLLGQVGVTYYTWTGTGAAAYLKSARITLDSNEKWFVNKEQVCGAKGDRLDIQNTFTHELCHAIGLAHVQDKLSSVYPQIRPGETLRRTLSKGDKLGIKTLYKL